MNWSDYYQKGRKNVIGVMKDELEGTIVKNLVELRVKTYSYLINDVSEHKKANGTSVSQKENVNLKIIKTV